MGEEPRPRRLGRGLAALIGDAAEVVPRSSARAVNGAFRSSFCVPIHATRASIFARTDLADLAASIREKGIIQPIVVRTIAGLADAYEIIAGERRWRAAQLAESRRYSGRHS